MVVAVVVVVVVGGATHVPPANGGWSPWRVCAGTAFRLTEISTQGLRSECVRWQRVTFFGTVVVAGGVVVPVVAGVVPVDVAASCGFPLPWPRL